jgi:chromosome segregation ATPase
LQVAHAHLEIALKDWQDLSSQLGEARETLGKARDELREEKEEKKQKLARLKEALTDLGQAYWCFAPAPTKPTKLDLV